MVGYKKFITQDETMDKNNNCIHNPLNEIVGALVISNRGLKFGIVFLVSDHSAYEKLIASKKRC